MGTASDAFDAFFRRDISLVAVLFLVVFRTHNGGGLFWNRRMILASKMKMPKSSNGQDYGATAGKPDQKGKRQEKPGGHGSAG